MPDSSVRSTNWIAAEASWKLARQRAAGAQALLIILFQRGRGPLIRSFLGLDAAMEIELLLCTLAVAPADQNPADGVVDQRVARLGLDDGTEAGQRPVLVAQVGLNLAQNEEGLGLAGLDLQ